MNKREIIKQHRLNRKSPSVTYFGNISDEDIEKILNTPSRHRDTFITDRVADTDNVLYEESYMKGLAEFYNQKWVDVNIKELNNYIIDRPRIATLDKDKIVNEHIDSPRTFRFLIMLEGSQEFITRENDGKYKTTIMKKGDIFFVNPSYPHMIVNTSKDKRKALLCDYPREQGFGK